MNVLIIEDEILNAEHLTRMLQKIDDSIIILDTLDSIKKSIKFLEKNNSLDLIFLDVHLSDGISLEIFNSIKIDIPIIFTTAYDEYALRAFKLNSVDYLLKPIGIEDLKNAIEKFKKFSFPTLKTNQQLNIHNAADIITQNYKSRFMVKIGDSFSSIKVEDASFFIAEDGITLLVTNEGKRYAIDYSIENLESLIKPQNYFRINRKVLVNIEKILQVSTYFNSRLKIQLKHLDADDSIVSRERVGDFKQWLDK